MVSANNQPLFYYDSSVYNFQALLEDVSLGMTILALVAFLLSILGPKLIGT